MINYMKMKIEPMVAKSSAPTYSPFVFIKLAHSSLRVI
jgi:hypothetical protein